MRKPHPSHDSPRIGFGPPVSPRKSGAVGLGILEKFKECVYENTAHIDIKDGQAVRLLKDFSQKTVVNPDVLEQARVFKEAGLP